MDQHYLKPLFSPQSIAVIGASDRPHSVGGVVFRNLLDGYQGKLFAVNTHHALIQGRTAVPGIEHINEPVDMAVIATPAATVPDLIESCGKRGVRAAVVLSAGFGASDRSGPALKQEMLAAARHYGMRLIGPNSLGVVRPAIGLNATFGHVGATPGKLALVSQSGALCTAILDWARPNDIGFSSVVSLGDSADVDFGEILDYLIYDQQTESILLYIEGIRQARSFMSALRAAARSKPVIVLKVGRHDSGSKAALSHTSALVGTDDAFDAALRRAGAVRVLSVVQLFAAAQALALSFRPGGNRLAIVTNGGGPGAMAADCATDRGIALAELSPETLALLNQTLPPTWSHGNPLDLIGDATAERYRAAVTACMQDPGVDGVLAILTPQAMTAPLEVANEVIAIAQASKKPLIACWMGESQVATSRAAFARERIPSFRTPEPAVEVFSAISAYFHNQKLLMQTPGSIANQLEPDAEGARMVIEGALAERRHVLNEMESKSVLAAFNIPVAKTVIVHSAAEALLIAEQFSFPVAMKIASPDITHKTDAGGVRLNLANAQAVRAGYNQIIADVKKNRPGVNIEGVAVEPMSQKPNSRELMVGVTRDPVFGPVITFGAGGVMVEVMGDRAVALPPLNRYLAQNLIDGTRVAKMLQAFRHMPPAKLEALHDVLLRVSEMVCELPWLKEMDINPLLLDENGALAVDARIVVDFHALSPDRYAHMAICPYPAYLVTHWQLPDGTDLVIRPIRPEDAEIEQAFVRNLSEAAKYFRFMMPLKELTQAMLARFTQIDYDREMALIAVIEQDGSDIEIAVCRYIINPDGKSCEFALVVADAWQHKGVGHKLMTMLMDVARAKGLDVMEGDVLTDNRDMLRLVSSLGFTIEAGRDDPAVRHVVKPLT
ncbi:MAG: bifunctional acetate--CoA ligase family protein/GNAT family N-acetyltransferase [Burkholderiales bacterium]|nr:bifunctional acetate--CoA ligase family protein/GNAT family N-acetyltransferase [Burkholderiales bacterium]